LRSIFKQSEGEPTEQNAQSPATTPRTFERTCAGCGTNVEEYAQGSRGELLCRACIRSEDEALLQPLTEREKHGLDLVANVLDTVSWKYWKPGEQPAKLLNWLYLGDLQEALDFELLARHGITAVLNLINWWELGARLPPDTDLPSLYDSHSIQFLEADSEDRLFFEIVEKSWPESEDFLKTCQEEGRRVLVNCKAGHNRSACICVCWLIVHGGMSLIEALQWVQEKRGTILSNHGFRLQLVRLALKLNRIGEPTQNVPKYVGVPKIGGLAKLAENADLDKIIKKKRLTSKYEYNSKVFTGAGRQITPRGGPRVTSLIQEEVDGTLDQRSLNMELLACLYHRGKNFGSDYEYTSNPPTVIGSGFSGDVVLCRRREKAAFNQNNETSVRCVKTFKLQQLGPDKRDMLKNEAVIYLSLEHPHIARLFDVYEDTTEVSLVMQYCSGGTLEHALKTRGAFAEHEFRGVAVHMLMAVNYIHQRGIVHRDIKPRNWVYEADGVTIKLIDFGFSIKGYSGSEAGGVKLKGCMGTLGYLAPEVVYAGVSSDTAYTAKCDIWSLGVVFFELLSAQPAFHKDHGMCDGYTEEVVLREIQEVTHEGIETLLRDAPKGSVPFLRRLLTKDPIARPSAQESLEDPYLMGARQELLYPPGALPLAAVLDRFEAHCHFSKTSRAWLLAVARSPTYLPWEDFCALRDTFKMFDARGLNGTVNFQTFFSVVSKEAAMRNKLETEVAEDSDNCESGSEQYSSQSNVLPLHDDQSDEQDQLSVVSQIRSIWAGVCGDCESLSYCEFLAVLLPKIEDVFEDVDATTCASRGSPIASPTCGARQYVRQNVPALLSGHWNPAHPVSHFLPLLENCTYRGKVPIFQDHTKVSDVVRAMSEGHHRWVLVQYKNGRYAFFDYMDVNHKLLKLGQQNQKSGGASLADKMAKISYMGVGALANCSGHSAYVPESADTPLSDILKLISGYGDGADRVPVRRVPIVDQDGELIHIFSCLDFLHLALQFMGPTAVLKSRAAKTFDCRTTILNVSVLHDAAVLDALRIMDSAHLTVCPATSRELSGSLGGVVAINVVSVADLKWVVSLGNFDILNKSVNEFITWRMSVATTRLGSIYRSQQLRRFNVVSVNAGDSLHMLAQRLLASRLQRIFLSSDELARIVGIVSSRDILIEILDQIL